MEPSIVLVDLHLDRINRLTCVQRSGGRLLVPLEECERKLLSGRRDEAFSMCDLDRRLGSMVVLHAALPGEARALLAAGVVAADRVMGTQLIAAGDLWLLLDRLAGRGIPPVLMSLSASPSSDEPDGCAPCSAKQGALTTASQLGQWDKPSTEPSTESSTESSSQSTASSMAVASFACSTKASPASDRAAASGSGQFTMDVDSDDDEVDLTCYEKWVSPTVIMAEARYRRLVARGPPPLELPPPACLTLGRATTVWQCRCD